MRIVLLGGFVLKLDGSTPRLSADVERLIAFLAIQKGRVPRDFIAGTLWWDSTQDHAFGSLRSALWRLRRLTADLVEADSHALTISKFAVVDLDEVTRMSERLDDPATKPEHLPEVDMFTQELLPGWYDDWVSTVRERHRQRCLHALEQLSNRHTEAGAHGQAIQAALAAIALDPLRESPHRQLIKVHLDEGNYSEAFSHYHHYRHLLQTELGIGPSQVFERLLRRTPVPAST